MSVRSSGWSVVTGHGPVQARSLPELLSLLIPAHSSALPHTAFCLIGCVVFELNHVNDICRTMFYVLVLSVLMLGFHDI